MRIDIYPAFLGPHFNVEKELSQVALVTGYDNQLTEWFAIGAIAECPAHLFICVGVPWRTRYIAIVIFLFNEMISGPGFLHCDLYFYCVTVKTIYKWKQVKLHSAFLRDTNIWAVNNLSNFWEYEKNHLIINIIMHSLTLFWLAESIQRISRNQRLQYDVITGDYTIIMARSLVIMSCMTAVHDFLGWSCQVRVFCVACRH